MKKLTVLLALSLSLLSGSTYAGAPGTTGPTIPESVNAEFSHDFARAKDVKWEEIDNNFFKATFDFNGKVLSAYFRNNADLIGVTSNLLSDKLPRNLSTDIKKRYAGYWITNLFKYRTADEHGFMITLENADKTITLQSTGTSGWEVDHVNVKN